MKILVTGGAGFIGSNFVNKPPLGWTGNTTIVLDNLTYAGDPRYIADAIAKGEVLLVAGDIADEKLVYNLLPGVDAVVHFAAESHNTRSENDPDIFYRTNVGGTRSLMTSIRKFRQDAGQKIHVTHVSTDEVYGPAQPEVFFKEEDFGKDENRPTSAYSNSKYEADLMMQTEFADLDPLIIRMTNNFGPCQNPEKALPRWICAAIDNRPLKVWGQGLQVRDWLYVGDTSKVIHSLIAYFKTGVVNIAANHQPEITNIELARMVVRILGKDESLIVFDKDPRPNHDFRYGLSTEKLRSLKVIGKNVWPGDFESQLKKTIRWYVENELTWRSKIAEAEALYK